MKTKKQPKRVGASVPVTLVSDNTKVWLAGLIRAGIVKKRGKR